MHAPHLGVTDHWLTQCTRHVETGGAEGASHVIFEMPPRHGKTLTISRLYPTWHLGRNPHHRVILASYGATLAYRNSRYARNLSERGRFQAIFPGVRLDPSSRAVDTWELQGHDGGMDASGVGGGLTGKGGHIIVVDDPVKSREEAESEVMRDKVYSWFVEDLYSRREPGAAVIVVMTRWHMDDLVGRLLNDDPDRWVRVRFPAIAEADDALGRAVGEALWPERFDLDQLASIRSMMGPYPWSALYQQNPVPAEGGLFKRAWFDPAVTQWPDIVYSCRFWDLAMSEKTSADYTVGLRIGQAQDGHYYIQDVTRRQIEWGDLTDWMAQVILQDGPAVAQGVEEKGFMSRAIGELNADPRLHGYQIWGYPVDKDKLTRALPVAAKLASGHLHMCAGHWNRDFVDEVCSFPKGAHDDQVDALSGCWSMLDPETGLGELHLAAKDSFGIGPY